jgi:hypothetical protein
VRTILIQEFMCDLIQDARSLCGLLQGLTVRTSLIQGLIQEFTVLSDSRYRVNSEV